MAADSIAKLAVIITGDASPLSAELAKASAAVNRWPASMRNLQNPLGPTSTNPLGLAAGYVSAAESARKLAHNTDGVASSTFKLAQALSAGRGNLAAIWSIGASGGPATAIAAAAAAAAMFARNIAIAADAIQVELASAVDEWAKKRDELFPSGGGPKLSFELDPNGTWTSAQANLTDEMGKSGLSLANVFRDLTDGASMAMKAAREYREELALINSGFMLLSPPEDAAKIDKRREELAVQMAILKSVEDRKKLAEEQEKKDEQAREKARRHIQDMAKDANDFAASLNTPLEALTAKFKELRELLDFRAISLETFDKLGGRLVDKYLEDVKDKESKATHKFGGTAAAERFTSAGVSALHTGQRELQRLEQISKQQLDKAAKAEMQRAEAIDLLKGFRPVVLMEGGL